MTDTTEFDLNLTLNQPLGHEQQVELFAFDDCKAYGLPDRKVLIRNPYSGKSAIVMPEVLAALRLCSRFATIREHTAAIEQGIPRLRGHADEIRQVLESMIRDGMLVSAEALCSAFNAGSAAEDAIADEPAIVAILSCDRPKALERLLDSIAEHGDPAGFETLYVIDDSRDSACIGRNQEVTKTFDAGSPIETVYFGRAEQEEFMARMIASAPEQEDSIRFLVDYARWSDEWSGGLARNFALLLSVGKRLVMLDDDALFQVYEPQPRPKGVNLRDDIREARFFTEPGAWPGMKRRPELDPVKAHLYCLGLPLGRALKRLGVGALAPGHLAGCTASEARRLKPDSPVLVTQCGSLGDPGVGNNTWLIELTGQSREKMLSSEENVASAIANRNVWAGRSRPHIGNRSNMALITGIDNRHPAPPYFPVQRSEDRLFGILVGMLFPDVAVLDLPWAAPHLPVEEPERPGKPAGFGRVRRFPEFFRAWIDRQPCAGAERVAHR